jgi:hypothetical protein
MRNKILSALAAAASILIASWLFMDASIFGLAKADPETGRGRGCYTALELIFGAKQPVEWVRPVEFAISGAFGLYGVALIVRWSKNK